MIHIRTLHSVQSVINNYMYIFTVKYHHDIINPLVRSDRRA